MELRLASTDDDDLEGEALSTEPPEADAAAACDMPQWAFTIRTTSLVDMGLRSTSTAPCCRHASAGIQEAAQGRGGGGEGARVAINASEMVHMVAIYEVIEPGSICAKPGWESLGAKT